MDQKLEYPRIIKMKVFAATAFLAASSDALQCLKCNADSWEKCAETGVVQTCLSNEEVCQVHERKRAGEVYRVRMECKKYTACLDNKKQNFHKWNSKWDQRRPADEGKDSRSVCRQCCNDTNDANCALAFDNNDKNNWSRNAAKNPKPKPGTCYNSNQCGAGWMCNFDDQTSGFCETCADKTSIDLCDDANFDNVKGFSECVEVCVPPENPYAPSS